ncbi:hypothetical protein KDM41_17580 [bacterium]|nr:hypothetical protein [bacterium]
MSWCFHVVEVELLDGGELALTFRGTGAEVRKIELDSNDIVVFEVTNMRNDFPRPTLFSVTEITTGKASKAKAVATAAPDRETWVRKSGARRITGLCIHQRGRRLFVGNENSRKKVRLKFDLEVDTFPLTGDGGVWGVDPELVVKKKDKFTPNSCDDFRKAVKIWIKKEKIAAAKKSGK